MSKETCCELFCYGSRTSDLAIIEGSFACSYRDLLGRGGNLDTLCGWLDLPRIVVIDVSRLDECHLAPRPVNVEGLLLDQVADVADARRWQTTFEALWGVPVLGFLERVPRLRAEISRLRVGNRPPEQLWSVLGDRLSTYLNVDALLRVAGRRPFHKITEQLFGKPPTSSRVHVSVAYDEALHRYFADTLDLLEARGAILHDFSLLRSDRLPVQSDVVYLGCGPAEYYAETLAGNHCMKQALRSHVRRGGRVYAEGSGLAYLSEYVVMPDGQRYPMCGLLPLNAIFDPAAKLTRPIEVTLIRDNWLGRAATRLRGYLNCDWTIEPADWLKPGNDDRLRALGLVGRHQVIGSRLNLDFAAQPQFVESFFRPVPPPAPLRQAG